MIHILLKEGGGSKPVSIHMPTPGSTHVSTAVKYGNRRRQTRSDRISEPDASCRLNLSTPRCREFASRGVERSAV
jgi:hypothetical protein